MMSVRLCQALNEKICHDFAGSIGVIDNSIQLTKSRDYQEKATGLIQNSTNKMIGRLQFYRHLYSIPFDNNHINIREINRLTANFLKFQNHNIQLTSEESEILNIKDSLSKIIMCIIIIASNNLKQDGVINLELKIGDNNLTITKITVTSEKLKLDDNKVGILLGKGDIDNTNIDNIHEYYTYYLMTEHNYQLAIIPTEKSIEYILTNVNYG
ncbi:MAG: histidine phosphotransferase family protein [Candidatus Rickettsia vulgarisii]